MDHKINRQRAIVLPASQLLHHDASPVKQAVKALLWGTVVFLSCYGAACLIGLALGDTRCP